MAGVISSYAKDKPRLNIKKAIKRPGALTAKADAAGETPHEFSEAHKHDKGLTGEQARFDLVLTGPKVGGKRKKK